MSDVSRDAAARNHYGIRAARSQLYGNGGDARTRDVRKMLSTSKSELLYFELLARGISIAACREEETRDNCNFSKYVARYLFITGEMGGAGYKQISRRDLRGSLSLSRKSSRLISPFISHGNRVDPSARIPLPAFCSLRFSSSPIDGIVPGGYLAPVLFPPAVLRALEHTHYARCAYSFR